MSLQLRCAFLLFVCLSLTVAVSAQQADLAVSKSGPTDANVGDEVTYQVVVTNNGPGAATGVTLADAIPDGMTLVSATQDSGPAFVCNPTPETVECTTATLTAGQSAAFTFVFEITGLPEAGPPWVNTATVTSGTPDPNSANNTSTVSTAQTAADLEVFKSGPDTATAGSQVTYTVTATNLGPNDAIMVTLDDVVEGMTFISATQNTGPAFSCSSPDPDAVQCIIEVFGAGQSATFDFVFAIDSGTALGTVFTNIASIDASTFDTNEENNAAIAVTVVPNPVGDLSVTKSGPTSAPPGGDVVYTITLANLGPSAATSVELNDTLPGNMTFVSFVEQNDAAMSCTTPAVGAGGTVTCTADTMPAGQTLTFTLTANIPDETISGTTYQNYVSATSGNDPNDENNLASTLLTVSSVDVTIDKNGPALVNAGTNIVYTLTVTNTGSDPATNVTLADALPEGTTFVSLVQNNGPAATCAAIAPGSNGTLFCTFDLAASQSAQFTLQINAHDETTVENTATVTTESFDTDLSDNSDTVTTTVTPQADLAVFKNGPATVTGGTDVTYTVTLNNNGASTAMNVSLSDPIPANMTFVSVTQNSGPTFSCTPAITCTIGSFASGATATFTFVMHVAPSATGSVENTATVSTTTIDPAGGNNSDSVLSTVATSANLGVTKSGPATALPGQDISYQVTVTNAGPSDAANVTLTDTVPANTTFVSATQNSGPVFSCTSAISCTIASFASGATATFTFVMNVSPSATGSVENTASISSTTTDPAGENNSSTVVSGIFAADLDVFKSGPDTVVAGSDVTYYVTVTNNGPSTATNVSLSDPIPAGMTFVSATQNNGPAFTCNSAITCTIAALESGASAMFTFVMNVSPSATAPVSNTATVTASTADQVPGNNSYTVPSSVAHSADLGVTKTGPATVAAGENVTYNLTFTNSGPSDAANAVLTDTVPPNMTYVSATQTSGPTFTCTPTVTCSIASFARGASATFTFVFAVNPAATGQVVNTALTSSGAGDPVFQNNDATVITAIVPSADLNVTKIGPSVVNAGSNATYTVTVVNDGPSVATNIVLTDTIPANSTFVSATQNSGPFFACFASPPSGPIVCNAPTLPVGQPATFTFVVNVNSGATGALVNTVSVSSATADPNMGNNSAMTTGGIDAGPTDLSITKTANGNRFQAGGTVTYTIVVRNNGPAVAFGTTVTDILPAGSSLQSSTATQGSCSGTTTVTCSVGTLNPASSATITLMVTVPLSQGQVSNTATVSAVNAETSPANNASTAALIVINDIPSLSAYGLMLLAVMMAFAGWIATRMH